ncbi:MAG: glycerol-3-phosphate 1-O-acyltransferase PlsB [Granulosicoccus sp.]|nr:glycerol-3-phosphate 1-O-acyltransferase PlsB [Granulosicoccus sp.]
MPQRRQTLRLNPLTNMMRLWVKPSVLPSNPAQMIDPGLPVLYVLEFGGAADRAALEIVARQFQLIAPGSGLNFGSQRESSSVDVLKRRQGTIFRKHRWVISRRLTRLVNTSASNPELELQIVPVAVYWGRAPEKESSLWKLWFSENWQIAGRVRKFMTTLIHGRRVLVNFSEPLSLATLTQAAEPSEILNRKLARVLRVHFRQRRVASLGPDQSHRRMLVDHVLADRLVRQTIRQESGDSDSAKASRRARRYANEIAADVSYPTVRILHRLLTRLWTELYDGVELTGIDRLKAVADGKELIYVPCHRSHIDYLLLSYILYENGFSIPHIAAGINLNLPVLGGLLRRGGAFFLRRSFAGNALYAAVFSAYLKELLQRGYALEYFIEGGRSRTGRLLPPKGGMLAMTIHAYLSRPETPIAFIPVYFGYERLLEGRAFTSELAGGKKQRESIFGLLKSLKTLREDYGRVYVSFGQAIELDQLLSQHNRHWREEPVDEHRPDWLKPIIDDLGYSIMCNINEATSVTPISLLSTAILSTPSGCISEIELREQLHIYQRLLKSAHEGSLIVVPSIDVSELIEHGCRLGFIEKDRDEVGSIIQLRTHQAAPLTYFKNNILHLLTLPALIAASFSTRREQERSTIQELVSVTFPILQNELFVSPMFKDTQFDQALHGLCDTGLLLLNENHYRRAPAGSLQAVLLHRLAQVVTPALERDFLCASILAQSANGPIGTSKLASLCKLCAMRLSRTHGRDANELFDKHLHHGFIQTLKKHDYIDVANDEITAKPALINMESLARTLLPEQSRHAILATSIEVAGAVTGPGLDNEHSHHKTTRKQTGKQVS